jgi:hypothetical protein
MHACVIANMGTFRSCLTAVLGVTFVLGGSCATWGRMLMYHMLAYGFAGFTALLVMGLAVVALVD